MTSPWVCAACRAKTLLPRLTTARSLSHSARRVQTQPNPFYNDGFHGLFQGQGAEQPARSGRNGDRTIGRYSGRELRPEELLNQLGESQEPAAVVIDQRDAQQRPRPRTKSQSRSIARPRYVNPSGGLHLPGPVLDPTQLQRGRNAVKSFIDLVNLKNYTQAWSQFLALAELCSQNKYNPTHPKEPDDLLFSRAVHKLSWNITETWAECLLKKPPASDLATPAKLFRLLSAMGATRSSFFRPFLWQAATAVSEHQLKGSDEESLVRGSHELVRMWRTCMSLAASRQIAAANFTWYPPSSQEVIQDEANWTFLPSTESLVSLFSDREQPEFSFETIVTALASRPLLQKTIAEGDKKWDWASAALITLDLLRTLKDGDGRLLRDTPECSTLANILESSLRMSPAPRVPTSLRAIITSPEDDSLSQHYRAVAERLGLDLTSLPVPSTQREATDASQDGAVHAQQARDPSALLQADVVANSTRKILAHEAAANTGNSELDDFVRKTVMRLGRAVERNDLPMVENVRRHIQNFATSRQSRNSAIPIEVYEHLMLAFLSLKYPKPAIEVWNEMIQRGYKPNLKTYTVMMQGAGVSRDVSGLEAFWKKMRTAGYQPDVQAWAIRIYHVLRLKYVSQGLQALNEMGHEWLLAARRKALKEHLSTQKDRVTASTSVAELLSRFAGDVDGVPRPNSDILNSAIAGLSSHAADNIPKVLSFGRSFGADPDLRTYNALINIAMRQRNTGEALTLLQGMNQRGIKPDSTTWTVLLTAHLQEGFLDGLDHAQQTEKILAFISSLKDEERGLSGIDHKTYALLIDRLLKVYKNPDGASAVLAHMSAAGQPPTPYIYTILITYFFQMEPEPNLAAVDNLWNQIQTSSPNMHFDTVFYDRMVEGYAKHHRIAGIQPALEFLQRARQMGRRPGWKAQEAVARALAERGQWETLEALVNEVRAGLRDSRGLFQRAGQREFWQFIIETGLLSREGITNPEQLLPASARTNPMLEAHG